MGVGGITASELLEEQEGWQVVTKAEVGETRRLTEGAARGLRSERPYILYIPPGLDLVLRILLEFLTQEIEHKQKEAGFMLKLFCNISTVFSKQAAKQN